MANIAMWSGPRNISTAMMYSFGNRPDCEAWDEPFYAFSLVHHGNDHPMRDEIIAADDSDWNSLVAKCLAPSAKSHMYQKHMTHHMLPGYDRTWIHQLMNAFLIRSPERVLTSYVKKWSDVDPSFPDKEIHLYGADSDSGTFDFFTEVINGKSKVTRTDYTASGNDNDLVEDRRGCDILQNAYRPLI